MDDLMKEQGGAGSEVAGGLAGWAVPEADASEMDPWIAFKRGDEPATRGTAAHAKKPRAFIGLRKREHPGQFSNP